MLSSIRIAAAGACVATVMLAGCGSSSTSPTPTVSATRTPSAAPRSPASTNPASDATLTSGELPGAPLTQISDGLLGGTPNTESRVFANTDRSVTMEIDLAIDTSTAAAATDFDSYASAAAKQAGTNPTSKTLAMGTKATEYVGVGSRGQNVVSIALLENTVICVVTYDSTTAADPSTVEAVAQAQAQKLQSSGF